MVMRPLVMTAFLVLLAREAAAAGVLTFDDITKTDLQVKFQSDCTPTQPPANFQKLERTPTKAGAFILYFDPTLIEPGRFGKFFDYTFYVGVAGRNPAEWYTCSTQVFTQGGFLDRSEPAHFFIHVGNTTDDGLLDVPIHGIASRDFIEITPMTTPAKVDLSQSAGIDLSLRNLLADQDLLVEPEVQVTASHPGYWKDTANVKLEEPSSKDVIRVHPGDATAVRLRLDPQKLPALLATLTSVRPDAGHETINIVISYRSDLGGVNRLKRANVMVRFVPSLISLLLALFFGSITGTVGAQFLPNASWKGWYAMGQKAVRGLVFSFIAEVVAMLLVALGSKFVFLQLDLDPWQFLPVFFIGIAFSGGKDLFTYIGLLKQQKQQAAAAGGEP
jgi:hypothetical protein